MPRLFSRFHRSVPAIGFSLAALLFAVVFVKADLVNRLHQSMIDARVDANGQAMIAQGRQIFRDDTFGDEDFWGGTLKLHQAIEGAANGGVGAGVSPKTALAVGLKVDVDALPAPVLNALRSGKVDLDDPAVTLTLLKLNAVVGVTGFFQ